MLVEFEVAEDLSHCNSRYTPLAGSAHIDARPIHINFAKRSQQCKDICAYSIHRVARASEELEHK